MNTYQYMAAAVDFSCITGFNWMLMCNISFFSNVENFFFSMEEFVANSPIAIWCTGQKYADNYLQWARFPSVD